MKASQLLKGKRAVHKVRFPICNFRCPILPDLPELAEQREADRKAWQAEHGGEEPLREDEIEVGLRVLTGLELGEILREARADAIKAGVEDPKEGNTIYDLAVQVHTLAAACVDPDAPEEPFFDGGVQQIRESEHLGRDGIMYLAEQQETWQDLCSPQALRLDGAELHSMIEELAGPESFSFFCQLRPGMRWTLLHSMASLLLISQTDKSNSSLPSEPSSTKSVPPPKRHVRNKRQSRPAKRGRRR
jgi:hypothetical protein